MSGHAGMRSMRAVRRDRAADAKLRGRTAGAVRRGGAGSDAWRQPGKCPEVKRIHRASRQSDHKGNGCAALSGKRAKGRKWLHDASEKTDEITFARYHLFVRSKSWYLTRKTAEEMDRPVSGKQGRGGRGIQDAALLGAEGKAVHEKRQDPGRTSFGILSFHARLWRTIS